METSNLGDPRLSAIRGKVLVGVGFWSKLRALRKNPSAEEVSMPLDPVCRKHVDIASAAASFDYHSETVYFCSVDCEKRFERDPEAYMRAMGEEDTAA